MWRFKVRDPNHEPDLAGSRNSFTRLARQIFYRSYTKQFIYRKWLVACTTTVTTVCDLCDVRPLNWEFRCTYEWGVVAGLCVALMSTSFRGGIHKQRKLLPPPCTLCLRTVHCSGRGYVSKTLHTGHTAAAYRFQKQIKYINLYL